MATCSRFSLMRCRWAGLHHSRRQDLVHVLTVDAASDSARRSAGPHRWTSWLGNAWRSRSAHASTGAVLQRNDCRRRLSIGRFVFASWGGPALTVVQIPSSSLGTACTAATCVPTCRLRPRSVRCNGCLRFWWFACIILCFFACLCVGEADDPGPFVRWSDAEGDGTDPFEDHDAYLNDRDGATGELEQSVHNEPIHLEHNFSQLDLEQFTDLPGARVHASRQGDAAPDVPVGRVQSTLGPPPPFVQATKFCGARAGMVFKTGERGLGYYRNPGPEVSPHVPVCDGVVLVLDDLIVASSSATCDPMADF